MARRVFKRREALIIVGENEVRDTCNQLWVPHRKIFKPLTDAENSLPLPPKRLKVQSVAANWCPSGRGRMQPLTGWLAKLSLRYR